MRLVSHWKGVIGSEASQMPDSLHLILTSTIANL